MAYRVTYAKRRLLCIALIAALCAQAAILFAQDSTKVVDVAVAGNKSINTDTIRNVISLKVGDNYSEQAIEKDKAAITALGSFSAVTVRRDPVAGGLKVTYDVTENPRVVEIRVVGSEPLSADQIRGVMKTKAGMILNIDTLNQDVERIQSLYVDQGYIAYLTDDLGVDAQTGVLTVPILVHTVESVEITGNKKTRSFVFLREMKTKPGSVYNRDILQEDLIRIYELDILEEIKPFQYAPGSEIGTLRVSIPVVEKKTGQISLGLGYSSRQRLVGQARLTETNFRGRGQTLNLLWEQGTSDAVGGSSSWEVGFFEPWVDKNHTSFGFNVYDKVIYRFSSGVFGTGTFSSDQIYNERHKGGDVTVGRPFNDYTRFFVGARAESIDTDPSLLGTSDLANIVMDGSVTAGSLNLVHNTRDIDIDPGDGGYEGVLVEYGTTSGTRYEKDVDATPMAFPFDGTFGKASVDVRHYFSAGGKKKSIQDKRSTLAMRLQVGYARGSLPFYEQFFVGGGDSLRGYREDRFWGRNKLLASIEFRKPVAQSTTGVLFVDYGDAWGSPSYFDISELPQTDGFQGHYGVGVGLRLVTPIGRIRLDYGVGDEGSRTHFSMGQAF